MEDLIDLSNFKFVKELFGDYDENINFLKKECFVDVVIRQDKLKILGEENNVLIAKTAVEYLLKSLKEGKEINKKNIEFVLDCVKNGKVNLILNSFKEQICINFKKNPIFTKTNTQNIYSKTIEKNTITFGVGIAGTGKTYIAVAKAVTAFKLKDVEKIVLTRPVVEAGERLGFLPGDFQSKIDPYLRPLYDVMEEIIGVESLNKFLERKKIEIVPLAYMRGRTLSNSFIILDEAQNTTATQMKMFLTRLGNGSKMVITGDITQVDLKDGVGCGLKEAIKILDDIVDVGIVNFNESDVVRHELVQKIIKAYRSKK